MSKHRRRTAPLRTIVLAGLVALAVLAVGSAATQSSWASAGLGNDTDTALVGSMAITHSYTATSCSTTARVGAATCRPTLGVQASPSGSTTDSIQNVGDVAAAQTVRGSSCAPVSFANAASATDPLLPRNTVVFQQPDTWGTSSAATFSGSGYATDIVGTGGSGLLGLLQSSFTVGLWFKASDHLGGGLMSLSASLSNGSGAANPTLWLDESGNVHVYVATTLLGTQLDTSGTDYGDGTWHFAAVTVATAAGTTTITLYVDGASKSAGGLSLLTSTSGIWHLGWSDFTGRAAPTSAYFHGSLSGAFVNGSSALSAAQVAALRSSSTAAGYRAAALGQAGISSLWMLGDDGVSTYTAALPGTEANICDKVNVTLTFTGPAATIGVMPLSTFADGGDRSAGTLAAGQTQGLTISTASGSGYNSDLKGIHLYVPMTFTYAVGAAPGWTQTMTWSGDPTQVFWA